MRIRHGVRMGVRYMFCSIPCTAYNMLALLRNRSVWLGIKAIELLQLSRCGCFISLSVTFSFSQNDVSTVLTSSASVSSISMLCNGNPNPNRLPVLSTPNPFTTTLDFESFEHSHMASPSSLGGSLLLIRSRSSTTLLLLADLRDTYAATGAHALNRLHQMNLTGNQSCMNTCSFRGRHNERWLFLISYESELNFFFSTGKNSRSALLPSRV
jgi:hypothetical protein